MNKSEEKAKYDSETESDIIRSRLHTKKQRREKNLSPNQELNPIMKSFQKNLKIKEMVNLIGSVRNKDLELNTLRKIFLN